MMVSGSDDGRVKVWSTTQASSVCTIDMRANVCCVKYNPATHNQVAVGCADHNVHIFDLRKTASPLQVLSGHRKAVSYVRYASSTEVVSASTDGTLRVWEIGGDGIVKTLSGHMNEKNFVGLSVTSQFVSCGSETNDVYVYYKHVSGPLAKYKFDSDELEETGMGAGAGRSGDREDLVDAVGPTNAQAGAAPAGVAPSNGQAAIAAGRSAPVAAPLRGAAPTASLEANQNQFISSLAWKGESSILLAANSQGTIKALVLDP